MDINNMQFKLFLSAFLNTNTRLDPFEWKH